MGSFDSIDKEIRRKTAPTISFIGKSIESSGTLRLVKYPINASLYYVGVTKILGLEDYNLYFTTNHICGYLFVYLTDSDENQAIGLVSHLAHAAEHGKAYQKEEVITLGNDYLMDKGFEGLIFLDPEDMGVYGSLKNDSKIAGQDCKILGFLILKAEEVAKYKQDGIDAIIQVLSEEKRDYLSVE